MPRAKKAAAIRKTAARPELPPANVRRTASFACSFPNPVVTLPVSADVTLARNAARIGREPSLSRLIRRSYDHQVQMRALQQRPGVPPRSAHMRSAAIAGVLRRSAWAVAAGRVVLGVTALARPSVPARPWVGAAADDVAARVFGRALGARDLALGLGALSALHGVAAERESASAWVAAGALSDALDVTASAASWGELPRRSRWLVAVAAGGAALTGAAGALVLWSARSRNAAGSSRRPASAPAWWGSDRRLAAKSARSRGSAPPRPRYWR
jgi:hypothetical protein